MECISNFKIAFLAKIEYKENFRNKKSKQYINDALSLKIKTLRTNKVLS